MTGLAGRRVLIAEDDYFTAQELVDHFRAADCAVIGPFSHVRDAAARMAEADLAVLDIYLTDDMAFPLADRLAARGTPFVFYTAYDMACIPVRFAHVGRLCKPFEARGTVDLLMRAALRAERGVEALLPHLRLSARLLLNDDAAADRLVEATLRLALERQSWLRGTPALAEWLMGLMGEAYRMRGSSLLN